MTIGKPERVTQDRVIKLFRDELKYQYLGDWTDREGNSNIEETSLKVHLRKAGYDDLQISRAIYLLRIEADNHDRGLYENNKAVYKLLRYGVPVKTEAGKVTETVHLIDWKDPSKNDFAIAQEVTLKGGQERRPDLVLYVNGIAIGVIELKNSRVSIGEGIRQSLSNQQPEFNQRFFSTIQLIFAGNDSVGALSSVAPFAPERRNSLATDFLSMPSARAICRWLIPEAKSCVIPCVLSIESLFGIGDSSKKVTKYLL